MILSLVLFFLKNFNRQSPFSVYTLFISLILGCAQDIAIIILLLRIH